MPDDDLFGIGFGGVDGDFSDDLPDDSIDNSGDAMGQMYQEFILEQARAPHGKVARLPDRDGQGADPSVISHQFNPTCGDDIVVRLCVDTHPGVFGSLGQSAVGSDGPQQRQGQGAHEPVIASMCWSGHGCAICQASLSVLHDMVTGLPAGRFAALYGEFHELMDSRGRGIDDPEKQKDLSDALAFQGTSRFPMRIKCALLGWEAVRDCLVTLGSEMERENHG
jgi:nitrogen fixation NifU-like protein